MSYRIAGFGWLPDPMDYRDVLVSDPRVQKRLRQFVPITSRGVAQRPASKAAAAAAGDGAAHAAHDVGTVRVDLRPWCPPIENQGNVGSCTANAVVGALEYFERKTRGQHVDASRMFLYRSTRRYLGWEGRGDTGAFVRSTIKALRLFGVAPEKYWPYVQDRFDDEPQAFHYALAQNFKAIEYFRVEESIEHLKSVLDSGLPFAFGFTCFSSIDDPEVARTGVIPFPERDEASVGGHAVLAVGYTDSHVIIRNSWGREWGDRGYGYLPWTYFDDARPLATDCWVLVNASWVGDVDPVYAGPAPDAAPAKAAGRPSQRPSRAPRKEPEPVIRIVRGEDPLRTLPMRMTARGLEVAAPAAPVPLQVSPRPAALYLTELTLHEDFDFALFGDATNELYLSAVVWDLSGEPPLIFPPKNAEALKGTYSVEPGREIAFVGDGLLLWPMKPVVGGLYVRILVLENDDDVRAIGKRLDLLRRKVQEHELTAALVALASGATAGTLTAVAAAAASLTAVLASLLEADDDDLVALFDGTYGAERIASDRSESYRQRGASLDLQLRVGDAPKTGDVPTKPRRKGGSRPRG